MEKPKSKASWEDLYRALTQKREFLAGCPEAHQNLKTRLYWIRNIARDEKLNDSYIFFSTVIDQSFAKPPPGFHQILWQAEKSPKNKKKTVNKAYKLIVNTTIFFEEDRKDLFSTECFFKKLSQNSEIIDTYNAFLKEKTDSNNNTLFKTMFKYTQKLISEYEINYFPRDYIKFPEDSSDGRISISGFLKLNEKNLRLDVVDMLGSRKVNSAAMEHFLRIGSIALLTLKSFTENETDTEKRLAFENTQIEEITQKKLDSKLYNDYCITS